jgi:hypothetical protein
MNFLNITAESYIFFFHEESFVSLPCLSKQHKIQDNFPRLKRDILFVEDRWLLEHFFDCLAIVAFEIQNYTL